MMMLHLKACPRCRGDLHTNRDLYGTYVECLQCVYMKDLPRKDMRRWLSMVS